MGRIRFAFIVAVVIVLESFNTHTMNELKKQVMELSGTFRHPIFTEIAQ
jgi:hypothetical protein